VRAFCTFFPAEAAIEFGRNRPEWHLGISDAKRRWVVGAFLILPILCLILSGALIMCTAGSFSSTLI
jgi:hypothetical protein